MGSEHRTPDEIERDVEQQRSELSRAIDEIQSRFTPESVVREVARGIGTHGSDVGRAVGDSVKQNPIALALTGVGLAWLMFGRSHDGPSAGSFQGNDRSGVRAQPAGTGPLAGEHSNGSSRHVMPGSGSYPGATAGRHRPGAGYPDWVTAGDRYGSPSDHSPSFGDRASRAAASARDNAMAAGETTSEALQSAGQSASDTARSAGQQAASSLRSAARSTRETAEDLRRAASDRAAAVRDQLSHGTEQLSDAARERVVAARERAMAARYQASRSIRQGWRQGRDATVDFFEDQPLVAGALALAAGAAVASAIPRTKTEDDWFGEESDRLIGEAERIFNEEWQKAERVGEAALDEAKAVAGEKAPKADSAAESTVKAATDEAREAVDRVRSAAEDEAERQKLGKPDV